MKFFSRWSLRQRAVVTILDALARLEGKVDLLTETSADLGTKLDKLDADVTTAVTATQTSTADLKAQIAALQAQISAGSGSTLITQTELDALGAKVDAIDAAIAPLVPPAPAA